jgi:hypothetical protein
MGYFLHIWGVAKRKLLLKTAFETLPASGALIVYDAIIDNERRESAWSLLASLNMLLQTPDGSEYTAADCEGWMREAGFRTTHVDHLAGPTSMVIGFK